MIIIDINIEPDAIWWINIPILNFRLIILEKALGIIFFITVTFEIPTVSLQIAPVIYEETKSLRLTNSRVPLYRGSK